MIEADLTLDDGRTLHYYDTGGDGSPVFWHHGTPNIGTPPEPLSDASTRLGLRWISLDRPGYGGSTPLPGRNMASVVPCVAAVADALGIGTFAVMGHSSGGPHALACGALLPDRVRAVVGVSGPAPFGAEGLDWFTGMSAGSEASLRAAAAGRAAKEEYQASAEFDPDSFTPADEAAFDGPWGWFGSVVRPAVADGPAALIDDDLANVTPWGFDPAAVTVPVLLMHGTGDRMVPASHSRWLAERCPTAELWTRPDEGHISVLRHAEATLDWLREHL
ncbi:alpha/beta fold hydrolase [Actinophytocola oryzae]|uniref:Pimeloyl-ACP methyl ester carboxylesterase n=1 Tax=Actinophytocola oryzae TaxID=502181 RepID=A0A4R7VST9_9PSEU|nr:alpha/beta hydrolase [Actinophytocola oryzae]TDV52449.1 pimeloyl-ACP methyl ester carboxylesterase [Actinophytocola oryzae]